MNIPELTDQEKLDVKKRAQLLFKKFEVDNAGKYTESYLQTFYQELYNLQYFSAVCAKLIEDIKAGRIISAEEKNKAEQQIDQLNYEIGALDVELKAVKAHAEQFKKRAAAAEARLQKLPPQPVQNVRNTPEYQELQKRLNETAVARDDKDKTITELNIQLQTIQLNLQTVQQDLHAAQSERDKAQKELKQALTENDAFRETLARNNVESVKRLRRTKEESVKLRDFVEAVAEEVRQLSDLNE